MRTNKTAIDTAQQQPRQLHLSEPPTALENPIATDSDEVYVTLPPGPYVPPWMDGEKQLVDRCEQGESAESAAAYGDVREYLLSQKEEKAAESQLRAQVITLSSSGMGSSVVNYDILFDPVESLVCLHSCCRLLLALVDPVLIVDSWPLHTILWPSRSAGGA